MYYKKPYITLDFPARSFLTVKPTSSNINHQPLHECKFMSLKDAFRPIFYGVITSPHYKCHVQVVQIIIKVTCSLRFKFFFFGFMPMV